MDTKGVKCRCRAERKCGTVRAMNRSRAILALGLASVLPLALLGCPKKDPPIAEVFKRLFRVGAVNALEHENENVQVVAQAERG